jgi:o-succinylbenzoate synthase
VTELHAKIDVLEGTLPRPLAGMASGLSKRIFGLLTLTRSDGTAGLGEASPLPGYSSEALEETSEELSALVDAPLRVDPLASPFEILEAVLAERSPAHPSSRFAIETALLDWLGHTRELPVHRVVAGDRTLAPIPIADLVMESDPTIWPTRVDQLVGSGATHVKLKVGADVRREVEALLEIRRSHPDLSLRLDGNGRLHVDELRRHAASFESMELELFEEPVPKAAWERVLDLPLPFALDESLRDPAMSRRLLETGRIRAVVLKPMVLGGFRASLRTAELAAELGAGCLVSHTFDGPVARSAAAELALALQTPFAAGLGPHPALTLWPPHHAAAFHGRLIVPHDTSGLGLRFDEQTDD